MVNEKKISRFDKEALAIIRRSVSLFIKNTAFKYDKKELIILDIGPQDYNDVEIYFTKAKIETLDIKKSDKVDYIANIEENNANLIADSRYDIVICTEVLEHTRNPFLAVKEIYRILKKGGILLLSVPFNFRIHGPLPDCWRFTEHGLRELLADFELIELKSIETKDRFLMPIHYTVIAQK